MPKHVPASMPTATLLITRELVAALLNPEAEPVQVLEGDGFTPPLTVAVAFSSPLAGVNYTEAELRGELSHYMAEHEDMLWREARRRALTVCGIARAHVDLPRRRVFVLVAQFAVPAPIDVSISLHFSPHA